MAPDPRPDGGDGSDLPADPRSEVEVYEVDDGVVLFDAQNPLAWLQARRALSLADVR